MSETSNKKPDTSEATDNTIAKNDTINNQASPEQNECPSTSEATDNTTAENDTINNQASSEQNECPSTSETTDNTTAENDTINNQTSPEQNECPSTSEATDNTTAENDTINNQTSPEQNECPSTSETTDNTTAKNNNPTNNQTSPEQSEYTPIKSDGEEFKFDQKEQNETPEYLEKHYWWAYVNDRAIKFWDKPWKVNTILWGNANRLTQALYDKLTTEKPVKMLQISAMYGNIMPYYIKRLHKDTSLDIIDIVPGQLKAAKRKVDEVADNREIKYYKADSTALPFEDNSYDEVCVFMLLHEQPEEVKVKTVNEAYRVLKEDGKLIFIDYNKPCSIHPLKPVMYVIYKWLEPFTFGLWNKEIVDRLHSGKNSYYQYEKDTYFGSLYQRVSFRKKKNLNS